ncbi:glycosyltransferase [Paenibacillus sp.]|uniref:glycosyltransferase n=1 Tax=Paenibacillus sp. TaxID=58172 RepID=UPI0028123AE8|nr:glycosyltransferase [Paenibacillus sp.]
MRILFTLFDLQKFGGTETFTYTIAKELVDRGNKVFCYSSKLGEIAEKFTEAGIIVSNNITDFPLEIDIIHAQHRMEAAIAYLRYPNVPMVFMSHGILPWQEQPVKLPSVRKYLAVSEEVQEHLVRTHNIPEKDTAIFRNSIDLDRFSPRNFFSKEPKRLLLISNRFTEEVKGNLQEFCQSHNIEFEILGLAVTQKWEVEKSISTADIVVSLGRGILEAMACGKISLVYDYNGGDGIVTPGNYFELRRKNFSGRTHKLQFTKSLLEEEVSKHYNEYNAKRNLEIIREFHDIKKNIVELESMYVEVMELGISDRTIETSIVSEIINEAYERIGGELIQKEKNLRYLIELKNEIETKYREEILLSKYEMEKLGDLIEQFENKMDARLQHLVNVVSRKDELNEHLYKQVEQLEARKEEITMGLNQLTQEVHTLTVKNMELSQLVLDSQQMIDGFQEKVHEFEQQAGEYNQKLLDYEKQLTQKENNTKYLLELNQEKNQELMAIYDSKAWKMVLKCRRLKGVIKKIRNNPKWAIKRILFGRAGIQKLNITPVSRPTPITSEFDSMVSVIIPVYDRTDVLRTSIDSILGQTHQNLEVIIVCDGSPKETLEIVDAYKDNEKVRIFKFFNNSGNAVRGRNKGIVEARGKYIAFQDSDDIAEPRRLEISLRYMENYDADIVYGGWRALVDGTRNIDIENGQEVFSPDCDYAMLKEICVPCQSTVMARTEALRKVGGLKTSMRYREDHELWLRLAYKQYKFKAIPEILTNLRLHSNNLELQFKGTDDHWFSLMLEEHKNIQPLKPKIGYVIPGCGISGGIAVICQHVNRLLKRGYDVILITEDDKEEISWFPNQKVEIVPIKRMPLNLDILVATGWSTAYTIRNLPAKRKFYFVQSDETRFHPEGSKDKEMTRQTYTFDYEFMTEAKWIQCWLKEQFSKDSYYVPNGLDEEIIHPSEPLLPKGNKLRVLLEGPIDIPYKGMEDAFLAVKDLDCEIWCVSSAGRPREGWRCDQFFEKLPMNKMKEIYSSCDIFLKMSRVEGFFGPPLEMMACGGACVVGEVTGYDEYIVDEYNALVVKQGDIEGAKAAVKRLIEDSELRSKLIMNGKKTADQWKWEPTIDKLEAIFQGNG